MSVRNILLVLIVVGCVYSCKIAKETSVKKVTKEERVVIANDSLEYEIIIIDQGFTTYLQSIAKPKWYYSEAYYKTKNTFYVTEWNIRVREPFNYSTNIYEQPIEYDANIDYGLEVDYLLYTYFKFVAYKYKVKPF
jgi:hypothetical protein